MDPFDEKSRIPYEVAEEIISYLPLKDRLNACLVSKHWNEVIGNSSKFKRNTILSIHSWDQVNIQSFHNLIKLSSRSYDNAVICVKQLEQQQQWVQVNEELELVDIKNVAISGTAVHPTEFLNAIKIFQSVKKLRFLGLSINTMGHRLKPDDDTISFENLETLVISNIDSKVFELLIRKYPKLKTVSLRFMTMDVATSPPALLIWRFFELNDSIEHLEMNFPTVQEAFKLDLSDLSTSLKLKSFVIGLNYMENMPIAVLFDDNRQSEDIDGQNLKEIEQNLEKLLKKHGSSLEKLKFIFNSDRKIRQRGYIGHMYHWQPPIANQIEVGKELKVLINSWLSLTVLKNLSLRFLKSVNETAEDISTIKKLPKNISIHFLGFQFINVINPQETILGFLSICPNLKELYVSTLNQTILNFCVMNLRSLMSIKCYKFEGDCLKLYNELKKSRKNANNLIKIEDGHVLG